MVFVAGSVVGNGLTKSQGSKGESHRGAHVDLHFGLMLVVVKLVCVCFHSLIQGEGENEIFHHKQPFRPWVLKVKIVIYYKNNDNDDDNNDDECILLTVVLMN